MSSRRLQNVFARLLQEVFMMSSRRLPRRLKDVFARRLQDVFKKTPYNYVLKSSWKAKKCHTEDVFKLSSRSLQYVFTKANVCWVMCSVWHES